MGYPAVDAEHVVNRMLNEIRDIKLRRSLSLSIVDAVLWAIMFGFSENYVVPFMLLVGASTFGVSLMQGLAQLGTAVAQLAGSAMIQRGGSRRSFARLWTGVHGASWVVVFASVILTHQAWLAIMFFCIGLSASNLSNPAWLSWMNDLVPVPRRAAFWGIRNRAGGIAQFAATSLAGLFLFAAKSRGLEMTAYGILFFLAFLSRFSDIFVLKRMQDLPMARSPEALALSFPAFVRDLRASNLGGFIGFMTAMSFLTMMMAPLIQVHLLREIGLNYVQYTAVTMTGAIAVFLFMPYWGSLVDRFGNRRILIATSLFLPVVALAWVFFRSWLLLLALQLFNGFLMAGFSLAGSTYVYDAVDRVRVTKTLAYYQTLSMAAAFAGSVTGGAIVQWLADRGFTWGILGPITTVFALIALGRLAVLFFGPRRFTEVRATEPSPGLHYFFLVKPYQDAVLSFTSVWGRLQTRKDDREK